MKDTGNDYKLVFNITYHYFTLKVTLSLLNITFLIRKILCHFYISYLRQTSPVIGFRRVKNSKDLPVRAKVSRVQKNQGFCGPCKKWRCKICEHIVSNDSFKSATIQRAYFIRPGNLKCSSENVVYLFTGKTCSKQYINLLKERKVKQESFNAHFAEVNHGGEDDWEVRLTDLANNVEERRKRKSFWQHELDTFQPNGLNAGEVALF